MPVQHAAEHPATVLRLIDGEASDTLGGFGATHAAGCECVIADDDLVAAVSDVLDVAHAKRLSQTFLASFSMMNSASAVISGFPQRSPFRTNASVPPAPLPERQALSQTHSTPWAARSISACVHVESTCTPVVRRAGPR
jgi:hypothetical protein